MSEVLDGQLSLLDLMGKRRSPESLPARKDPAQGGKAGQWELPGFEEARERLHSKGLPFAWVDRTADPAAPFAAFLPGGKPAYRSECPEYGGYLLDGGVGAVRCRAVSGLLPGLHWYFTCGKTPDRCPFRDRREAERHGMD